MEPAEPELPEDEDSPLPLEDVVDELAATMQTLYSASRQIRTQMKAVYRRAAAEQIDWMEEPRKPKKGAATAWCAAAGLPARPTISQFLDAVYSRAVSLDLESRVLIVTPEDARALWSGRQRLTVFEVVAALPTVLE